MTTIQSPVSTQQTAPQKTASEGELPSNATTNAAVVIAKRIEEERDAIASNLQRIDALTLELKALEKAAARDAKIADLKQQRTAQQALLQRPQVPPKEEMRIWASILKIEEELAQIENGQTRTQFWESKVEEWNREAGILRSRLSDGGVTLDRQGIDNRLLWLEGLTNLTVKGLQDGYWKYLIK